MAWCLVRDPVATKEVEWEPAVVSMTPENLGDVLAEMDGYLANHNIRTGGAQLMTQAGFPLNVRFLTELDLPGFCSPDAQGEFGFQIALLPGFRSAAMRGNSRILSFGSRFALLTGEITEADLQDAISRICAFYLPDTGILPVCGSLVWKPGEVRTSLLLGRDDLRRKLLQGAGVKPVNESCGLGWSPNGVFSVDPRKQDLWPHPSNVFFVIADQAGVIPPIAMLTNERAAHYFQHGSHEAEPPGVHLCFGGRGSFRTARACTSILGRRLDAQNPRCWMLNLGALGGPHGKPIDIGVSVSLLKAALNGTLAKMSFQFDTNFHILVPVCCPGVPSAVLDQRTNWVHARDYEAAAKSTAALLEPHH